jgi:hypothetical protein
MRRHNDLFALLLILACVAVPLRIMTRTPDLPPLHVAEHPRTQQGDLRQYNLLGCADHDLSHPQLSLDPRVTKVVWRETYYRVPYQVVMQPREHDALLTIVVEEHPPRRRSQVIDFATYRDFLHELDVSRLWRAESSHELGCYLEVSSGQHKLTWRFKAGKGLESGTCRTGMTMLEGAEGYVNPVLVHAIHRFLQARFAYRGDPEPLVHVF